MLSDAAVSGALNLFANNHSWCWALPGETRVLVLWYWALAYLRADHPPPMAGALGVIGLSVMAGYQITIIVD
ncbi:hypothetical protein ACFLVW_05315 [Chloroflexota bacterium]